MIKLKGFSATHLVVGTGLSCGGLDGPAHHPLGGAQRDNPTVAFGDLNLKAWNDGLRACDGQTDDLVHQWLSGQFDPLFAAGL